MTLKCLISLAWCAMLSASGNEWYCGVHHFAETQPNDPAQRKFTPERQVDVLHLALNVEPDFKDRSVTGTATISFKVLKSELRELRLNAEDLRVSEVRAEPEHSSYQNTGEEIIIYFREALAPGTEGSLSISYQAYPKYGLYFRTKEMGYKAEDEHIFTQGEDIEARHWFPCFDHPNEKFTSEVTCTVPEEMTVLSNGKRMSEERVGEGKKAVRWLQDKPHVSYLISLVAGNLKKIEDNYNGLPMAFYTPASQIQYARNSFEGTKDMMAFFEKEIGVPYPWDKYDQVCVQDFMWGGMENTSISTLADRTLFPDETENLRSSQGLVAHELAHQWFGDLVTCQDWSQIWLNEGFATYYSHLYNEHKNGRDDFLYRLWGSARGFINRSSKEDQRPTVYRQYGKPTELFGHLVYSKGAWVLHMLRSIVGEEAFRQSVKTYIERHQFDTVATHDLISAFEDVTGQSFDLFFDQWVFRPHHPELRVTYSWDEEHKMAKLAIAQTQELTDQIGLFEFPLTVRFGTGNEGMSRVIQISEKEDEFFFPLEKAPAIVRVDPELAVLAKISFNPPRKMIVAQLKDESDVMGRVLALDLLSKSRDKETIGLIAERLNGDPFHGVRLEAADALRAIHTPEALEALLASNKQEDARVRNRVANSIGSFYDERALEWQLQALKKEANPDIAADLIRGIAAFPSEQLQAELVGRLESTSYENVIAQAAISAMKEQGSPVYVEPLLQRLSRGADGFNSHGYSEALNSLAYLARNEESRDAVLDFLSKQSRHPRQTIRLGALQALGTLNDERAIPVLTRWLAGGTDLPESARANRALEKVRAGRPAAAELETLRKEVLELKSANDELKKSFAELQKKFDASAQTEKPAEKRKAPAKAGKR